MASAVWVSSFSRWRREITSGKLGCKRFVDAGIMSVAYFGRYCSSISLDGSASLMTSYGLCSPAGHLSLCSPLLIASMHCFCRIWNDVLWVKVLRRKNCLPHPSFSITSSFGQKSIESTNHHNESLWQYGHARTWCRHKRMNAVLAHQFRTREYRCPLRTLPPSLKVKLIYSIEFVPSIPIHALVGSKLLPVRITVITGTGTHQSSVPSWHSGTASRCCPADNDGVASSPGLQQLGFFTIFSTSSRHNPCFCFNESLAHATLRTTVCQPIPFNNGFMIL